MATEKKTEIKSKKTVAPKVAKTVAAPQVDNRNGLQKRKVLLGVVVSDKMQKTIVVKVERRVRDELYKKYVTKARKFKAHDEKNEAKVGDLVSIIESRPLSSQKRWALQEIVRKAVQTVDANI